MADTLAVGRIAWWRFQNGSLEDSSGNGNHAIATATLNFVNDKDGVPNNAVTKPTSEGEGILLGSTNLIKGLTQFTFNLFIKRPPLYQSVTENIISFTDYISVLAYQWSNTLRIYDTASSGMMVSYGVIDVWQMWTFEYNNGSLIWYIDNVVLGSCIISFTNANNPIGLLGISPLNIIDEVSLYNVALTAGERAELLVRGVNYQPDTTPPSFNSISIDTITQNSAKLNVNCNEDSTAYYEIRESPTNNAKIGDILTEPESGWTRYYASDTAMFILEEDSFKMTSEFRKNLKVGDKLRILYAGNVLNDIYEMWGVDLSSEGYSFAYASMIAIDIVLPSPTPEELKVTHTGIIVLTATVESQVEITGLAADREYDCYLVAEDTAGNLQATPTKIQFTTLSSESYSGYLQSPEITIAKGKVLISSPQGYEIRYTLDGSTPTSTSTLYTAPISISSSCVVSAISIGDSKLSFPTVKFASIPKPFSLLSSSVLYT